MATLAAGLAAGGGRLALVALAVVLCALAIGAAPDWGHRLLALMRDWRAYRRESEAAEPAAQHAADLNRPES
jgi:hypothetical protein